MREDDNGKISIHAPREGCDGNMLGIHFAVAISIHAPREGCDPNGISQVLEWMDFNPRTPRGVRPQKRTKRSPTSNFNPRTPRGVRQADGTYKALNAGFQSTHPARGATAVRQPLNPRFIQFQSTHPARGATGGSMPPLGSKTISIHAPREGCDPIQFDMDAEDAISIHAPREGCDRIPESVDYRPYDFNPRTPRGVRPDALRRQQRR